MDEVFQTPVITEPKAPMTSRWCWVDVFEVKQSYMAIKMHQMDDVHFSFSLGAILKNVFSICFYMH